MPPSTLQPSDSPAQRWARDVATAYLAAVNAAQVFDRLRAVPAGDGADRLAALWSAFQALGLPSPATTWDQADELMTRERALHASAESAASAFRALAASVDAELTRAVRDGHRHPEVVAVSDFADGLVYVELPASPYELVRGLRGHHVAGLGEESPIQFRGLASRLPKGHPLLALLPESEMLQTPGGPAFVLGVGVTRPDARGVPVPQVRPWVPTADVVALTQAARAQQRRDEERQAAERSWEEAQRAASRELRRTPEQEKAERELAETRRQLQEQREAAERTQAQLRDLLRRQEELELEARRGEVA